MQYDIHLERINASRPTAVVRRRASVGDLPKVVPDACGLVWRTLRAEGVKGAGRHVALYLDEVIDLEVGVELHGPYTGHGEVVASTLPSGTVATVTHFGPYNRLADAHHAIRDWCSKQGHTLAGTNWEIYGHWEDAWNNDPSKIRTDVHYLLK